MSREFHVAWGEDGDGVLHESFVSSVDELECVLDEIELRAIQDGAVYEVDLWLSHMRSDDPILLQFLIGHSERSSLLWHQDGATMVAAAKLMHSLGEGITCKRFRSTRIVDPDLTRIAPTAVRSVLIMYLLTNARPEFVLWSEAAQN